MPRSLAPGPVRANLRGMRRPVFLAPILALAAAGCTNYAAERAAFLNTLVGQPESAVVAQLGVPAQTFDTGGHHFLAYTSERASVYGTGFGFGGGGGYGYGRGFGFGGIDTFSSEVVPRVCQTTFDLVGGRVQTWALHGNGC